MEIKKFEIDEKQAEVAKTINSFSDYKEGSATNEYYSYLKQFSDNVEYLKKNAKITITPEIENSIQYYADRYSSKLAKAINLSNCIEARCPSLMIAGAGNFNVRAKEKQNKARESFWEKYNDLFNENNYYIKKIDKMLNNTTIYSNDEFAIEKLENKIADLEASQDFMKQINAYYRKNKTLDGCELLTDKQISEIKQDMQYHSWYDVPFAPFTLQGNNAEIRRLKDRIEDLKKLKARAEQSSESKYQKVDGLEVVEDTNDMRIRIIFEEIPSYKIRELLKHNGFKWSPKNSAWQRQLTANGIWSTKQVLKQLGGNL